MSSIQDSYYVDPKDLDSESKDPEHRYRYQWLPVSLVCRHWFVVASTTPRLWRNLIVGNRLDYLRTGLARSKGTSVSTAVISVRPRLVHEALELLIPHTHRLRGLSMHALLQESFPSFYALLQHGMPALEQIAIHAKRTLSDDDDSDEDDDDSARENPVINFAPKRFPNLRCVTVSNVYLIPSPIFGQLTRLHINGWRGRGSKLTEILQACVSLEHLRTRSACCRRPSNAMKIAPVILPKLRWFFMETHSLATIEHILSILTLPPNMHVEIRQIVYDYALIENGFRPFIPADTSSWAFFPHLQEAEILLQDTGHRVKAQSTTPNAGHSSSLLLTVLHYPTGWTNGVEEVDTLFADDVLGVLRGAPLERLHIELPAREIGRIDWRAAFAPFHQLRQLSVRGTGTWRGHRGAVTLYQSLNPCLTSGAGVGTEMLERLVLPELRSLRIEGFDADDNTASVLKLALTNRMDFLGRPRVEALDELSFETSGYRHSEESFRRQRTAYQELFEPCVQRLTYAPGHGGPNW